MDLDALRAQLDAIDRRLVDALSERLAIVTSVAGAKLKEGLPLRHVVREEDILTRVAELARDAGVDPFFVSEIFQRILDHSVRIQQELLTDVSAPERAGDQALRVGYQGTDGAYSHLAAQRHFGARGLPVAFVGFESFRAVFEALQQGTLDRAVLPIENTTAGSINDVYDLLAEKDLFLVGEEVQRVDHCLVTLNPEVKLGDLRRVYSHPQALAQCTEFLSTLLSADGKPVHVESFTDTAMAVKKVRAEGDPSQAAIASSEAARLHGLHVLRRGLANQRENFTRMVVVAREAVHYDLRIPCKTSIIFALRHEEGALLHCMEVFAAHHLNLTKLESRPRPRAPWEYLFYVDFEGNVRDSQVVAALADLPARTSFLRVLGSYPARNTSEAKAARPRPLSGSSPGLLRSPSEAPLREAVPESSAIPPRQPSHPLSSRSRRPNDTILRLGEVTIGGSEAAVLLGLSASLSEAVLRDYARAAKASGVQLLVTIPGVKDATSTARRKGKRSSVPPPAATPLHPDMGRVLHEEGLIWIAYAQTAEQVQMLARTAEALWLDGRLMDDRRALEAAGSVDRTIFLERASMASTDEWLGAAEVILERGNQQVALVEAGTRSFAGAPLRNLDIAATSALIDDTHLPIVVHPASCVDNARALSRLSHAALAAGADGVVIAADLFDGDLAALGTFAHGLSQSAVTPEIPR